MNDKSVEHWKVILTFLNHFDWELRYQAGWMVLTIKMYPNGTWSVDFDEVNKLFDVVLEFAEDIKSKLLKETEIVHKNQLVEQMVKSMSSFQEALANHKREIQNPVKQRIIQNIIDEFDKSHGCFKQLKEVFDKNERHKTIVEDLLALTNQVLELKK